MDIPGTGKKKEYRLTIAIGVVLVVLVAIFLAKKRFFLNSPSRQPEVVITSADEAVSIEDIFADTSPEPAAEVRPGPPVVGPEPYAAPRPAPPIPAAVVEATQKTWDAGLSVSVGGEPDEAPVDAGGRAEAVAEGNWPDAADEVIEPVVTIASRPMEYVVRKGDALSTIARKFYGNSNYKIIAEANNLTDPNMLKVGMRLTIPLETPISASVTEAPAGVTAPAPGGGYTVKKNDSLWTIAQAVYGDGTKWQAIFQANRGILKHKDDLKIGQVLTLPAR